MTVHIQVNDTNVIIQYMFNYSLYINYQVGSIVWVLGVSNNKLNAEYIKLTK